MKPTTCPYLSIMEDPETQLAFPSVNNCCRRARPVEPVSLEHQATHCLSTNFIHCPVPANKLYTPLPIELRASVPVRKGYLTPVTISTFIIISLVVVGLWQIVFLTRASVLSPMATEGELGILTTPNPLSTNRIAIPTLSTYAQYTSTVLSTLILTDLPSPSETPTPGVIPALLAPPTNLPIQSGNETVCIPPSGWIIHIVQPNDSFFQIGQDYGITVTELQEANCMGSLLIIYTGQKLYVPNVPTRTPPIPTTQIPTKTVPPPTLILSDTSIPTPTLTRTNTPIPTRTRTYTPTPTPTLIRTNTPIPTLTRTNTPIPTPTPIPTNTPIPTPTPIRTNTPIPTLTRTNTPIPTPTPIPTNTPIPPTPTPIPTNTRIPPTPTLIPTDTPIPPTPTRIRTDTPIPTPTLIPTDTPIPPTPTLIPTDTPIPPTPTLIPTDTPIPPTPTSEPPPTDTIPPPPTATVG